MVRDLVHKKQIYILILLVVISIFSPTSIIISSPHAILKDIIIIFSFSIILSFIFLFFRKEKQIRIFFKTTTELLFFVGCSFLAIYFIPTVFALIKGYDYFFDGLLPISLGAGICIAVVIYQKLVKGIEE